MQDSHSPIFIVENEIDDKIMNKIKSLDAAIQALPRRHTALLSPVSDLLWIIALQENNIVTRCEIIDLTWDGVVLVDPTLVHA